jgi:hypothetical protein
MDRVTIKTRQQWSESRVDLGKFLQVGDFVDDAFADRALGVLRPAHWTSTIIQIGEPNDHIDGRATFFRSACNPWQFMGYCWRMKIREPHAV